ncbi:sulfate transporter [Pseudaestuariivita atlantica]|uniref:Sulfate transporter n=2 Tax=Pseudaestuariivita atlantica TaxID=1317121 RepID=A0A0L1JT85_9RHOB|nr:SulP family inorganic anion transporter [Pseudaestuariivita atlantica]KNG94950.1 sulfate transporter [Pseudaestuariivita atlantica]
MRPSDFFPPLNWAHKITASNVRSDAFAGFTNAAIVLPQAIAFATIAGLPPQYGLYTAIVTAVVAALWGSSMVMVSGPTTAISAVLFATLADMAVPGTAHYIQLALILTILVGLFQLAAGLVRLGGLVSFVSHSVITAFTAAAAVLIAVSQLAGALGVHVEPGGNVIERLLRLGEHFIEVNPYAVAISATTFVTLITLARFAPRLPGFLIALVVGAGLAQLIGAADHDVAMVSSFPAALPRFDPPEASLAHVINLAPGALAIALIGLLEAISIGRSFAVRRKEPFDANQEMIGQGLSNVAGGLTQCYAGSGSFTRSGVNAAAGAVTPLSGIFASAFLAVILVFVSPYVSYIPIPAMAGLILYVAWRLIDIEELRHIIETSRPETLILALTLAAGLLIELDFAIYVGVIASLCVFVYETAYPEVAVTVPVQTVGGNRKFADVTTTDQVECPQVVVIRVTGALYFGSVDNVSRAIKSAMAARPRQVNVVLYLKSVRKLDLAAGDMLIELIRSVRAAGGEIHLVAGTHELHRSLERFHVIDELGPGHIHDSKTEAVVATMTHHFKRRICQGCIREVFRECDALRDGLMPTGGATADKKAG